MDFSDHSQLSDQYQLELEGNLLTSDEQAHQNLDHLIIELNTFT